MQQKKLSEKTETAIRFSEVDSMGVVWHGNYIKYFEDGREAFGNKYGLAYMDFYERGILTPLVKMSIDFKRPVLYGEKIIIEIKYIDCEAAKLKYEYIIYQKSNMNIVATGSSVQAFLDINMELLLTFPPFFVEWKKKWGFI